MLSEEVGVGGGDGLHALEAAGGLEVRLGQSG